MTRVTMTLIGQDKLELLITMKLRSFQSEVAKIGDDMMGKMTSKAKELVPVDTGALQASIEKLETVSTPILLTFGFSAGSDSVTYARHVEWGTYKMQAQPYMRPAALAHHRMLLDRLAKVGSL